MAAPSRRRPLALVVTVLTILLGVLVPVAASADPPHRTVTVSILDGSTSAPIDGITLQAPATSVIRGRVLDEHGRGVDGFVVQAWPGYPYYTGEPDNVAATALTYASPDGYGHGYYELWVPAGEYDLLVSGTINGEYGPDWQGPTIVVGENDEVTFDDIYMRPHHAGFMGKVRDGAGRGVDGIQVEAWLVGDSAEPAASALTYASRRGGGHGYYELFLPDNTARYVLRFSDPSDRYADQDYRGGLEVQARSRVWKHLLPTTLSQHEASGVVTDQFGRPIGGADVTLLQYDGDAFVPVADGNGDVMDPSANTDNPSATYSDGSFEWHVVSGSYEVSLTSASSGGASCFVTNTGPLELPPARTDLLMKATCPGATAPAPASAPALFGTTQVGEVLTMTEGTWNDGLLYEQTEWLRDGAVVGTGSSYTLTAADKNERITARVSARRPAYVQEAGEGATVSFTAATFDLLSSKVRPAHGGGRR